MSTVRKANGSQRKRQPTCGVTSGGGGGGWGSEGLRGSGGGGGGVTDVAIYDPQFQAAATSGVWRSLCSLHIWKASFPFRGFILLLHFLFFWSYPWKFTLIERLMVFESYQQNWYEHFQFEFASIWLKTFLTSISQQSKVGCWFRARFK